MLPAFLQFDSPLFPRNGLFDSRHNIGGAEAVFVHEKALRAYLTKGVLHTHKFLHRRMVPGETARDSAAKAAGYIVVFRGDNGESNCKKAGSKLSAFLMHSP